MLGRFIILGMIFLASCTSSESSSVTIFSDLTKREIVGKTISIRPFNSSLTDSLEFATYKKVFARHFENIGFHVVSHNSDDIAIINYGVDNGKLVTEVSSTPIYGQTGGGTSTYSGPYGMLGNNGVGMGFMNGNSQTTPTYGIVGSQTHSRSVKYYTRFLTLDIFSKQSSQSQKPMKLYEAKVTSVGTCPSLAGVFAPMVKSLFHNFFAMSGTTKKITLPLKEKC